MSTMHRHWTRPQESLLRRMVCGAIGMPVVALVRLVERERSSWPLWPDPTAWEIVDQEGEIGAYLKRPFAARVRMRRTDYARRIRRQYGKDAEQVVMALADLSMRIEQFKLLH